MRPFADRLRRHIDDIDPTRAHARVGIQAGIAIALSVLTVWPTSLWPQQLSWAAIFAWVVNLAIASRTGSLRHELIVAVAVAATSAAALALGTYVHAGTGWFLPAAVAVGFLTGLGIGFDVVGRKIGIVAFAVFALAATLNPGTSDIGQRLVSGAIGFTIALAVIVAIHLAGRALRFADFGYPRPPPHVFKLFPCFDRQTLSYALRLATAVLVASVVAELLEIDHPLWMMLTIVIVMQRRLGDTLIKGVQRASGTLVGVVAGWIIVSLAGAGNAVWLLLLVPVFVVGRYLYVPANYAIGMACSSAFVILAYAALGAPVGASAFERLADTLVAAVIGIAASLFIVPERAGEAARLALIAFFRGAAVQYRRALSAALGEKGECLDDTRAAFEAQARRAAREIAVALWEAMPGRRIFGLRREIRVQGGTIFREIRDLGEEVGAASRRVDPAVAAQLREEGEAIARLLEDLAASVEDKRGALPEAEAEASRLLADIRASGGPFAERRIRLLEAIVAFQSIQRRRFPGPVVARELPAGRAAV